LKTSLLPTKLFFSLLLGLFGLACGEANPLVGTWNLQLPQVGNAGLKMGLGAGLGNLLSVEKTMTFTRSEVITKIGPVEERQEVKYRHDGRNTWSFSSDGQHWTSLKVMDKDTLEMDAGAGLTFTLKRVK